MRSYQKFSPKTHIDLILELTANKQQNILVLRKSTLAVRSPTSRGAFVLKLSERVVHESCTNCQNFSSLAEL